MSVGFMNMHSSIDDFPGHSARLRFVPKTKHLADAEARGTSHLSNHLSAQIAENWPPNLVTPPVTEHASGWKHSYLLHPSADGASHTLVGIAGHKKWSDDQKTLQIGTTLIPQYHGKRLGEEVVAALGTWGLAQPGIDRVICDVPAEHRASALSLERAGFTQSAEPPAPGFLRYEVKHTSPNRK